MKNGKFEISDLETKDQLAALITLLLHKEVFTMDELKKCREVVLDNKNKELEEELKENPGMDLILELFSDK